MIAIKVRIMVISGGGEVEGSCDGKWYKVKFYVTGNALVLELGVHFRVFFKQCIFIIYMSMNISQQKKKF